MLDDFEFSTKIMKLLETILMTLTAHLMVAPPDSEELPETGVSGNLKMLN